MLPKWNSEGRETYMEYCLNRRTLREYSKPFVWKPITLHVWSKGEKKECDRPFYVFDLNFLHLERAASADTQTL